MNINIILIISTYSNLIQMFLKNEMKINWIYFTYILQYYRMVKNEVWNDMRVSK